MELQRSYNTHEVRRENAQASVDSCFGLARQHDNNDLAFYEFLTQLGYHSSLSFNLCENAAQVPVFIMRTAEVQPPARLKQPLTPAWRIPH